MYMYYLSEDTLHTIGVTGGTGNQGGEEDSLFSAYPLASTKYCGMHMFYPCKNWYSSIACYLPCAIT